MSTKRFFETIRPLFKGRMTQDQVDGCKRILGACKTARANRQNSAYILATAAWETAFKMEPVQENLSYTATRIKTVFGKRAKGREKELEHNPVALANVVYANRNGNGDEASGDGWRYSGKGAVQLTFRDNYKRMGDRLGLRLEANPELALDPEISARILVEGMLAGAFTGVSLDDVSEPETSRPDFTNDRAVVNGKDRATEIDKLANVFYEALEDVDLLAKSRTVQAAKSIRRSSDLGAVVTAAGAAVATIDPGDVIEQAGDGAYLADLLGVAPWIVIAILLGLFLWNRLQANRAEAARREDNEVRGV